MDKREALRALVADFFETTPDRVDDGFRLAGPRMQGSVARYALDAALRRKLGVSSRAAYTSTTFGELAGAILGGAAAVATGDPQRVPQTPPASMGNALPVSMTAAAPTRADAAGPRLAPLSSPSTRRLAREMGVDLVGLQPTGARGRVTREDVLTAAAQPVQPVAPAALPAGMLACGIDIEMVDNMPAAVDHWRSDFYAVNFTPAEIAYCLLQERPAMHFAGRWCAKEALKKCDNAFLHEPMGSLELARDASGEVYFRHREGGRDGGHARRLPFAVSISHTPTTAVAVVARLAAAAPAVRGVPTVASAPSPVASPPSAPRPQVAPEPPPAPARSMLGGLAALPRSLFGRLLR